MCTQQIFQLHLQQTKKDDALFAKVTVKSIKGIMMNKLIFFLISCVVIGQQATCAMAPLPPLHQAIQDHNIAQLNYLLDTGANVNQQNDKGETALHRATLYNNVTIMRLLLKHHADVNKPDNIGETPLHTAAAGMYLEEAAQVLLDNGANINQQTLNGATPLLLAAQYGTIGVVRLLLNYGANINQPNHPGNTPLHFATSERRLTIIALLLAYGANANLSNCDGYTPLNVAEKFYHCWPVVPILTEWPNMQQRARNRCLVLCTALHPRLGTKSPANMLDKNFLQEILHKLYAQEIFDFQTAQAKNK
jgi:ankyrin repeat protein